MSLPREKAEGWKECCREESAGEEAGGFIYSCAGAAGGDGAAMVVVGITKASFRKVWLTPVSLRREGEGGRVRRKKKKRRLSCSIIKQRRNKTRQRPLGL